jgi:hypothetical protein
MLVRALDSNITLDSHIKTIESYLNEYKQSDLSAQRTMSNAMMKYIIVSCWKKMNRRAFSRIPLSMIGVLTFLKGYNTTFPDVQITTNPDPRLVEHLTIVLQDGQSFGQSWLKFHPSQNLDPNYLDDFTTLASGTSQYIFDRKISIIFLDLLLCSLYGYLCTLERLQHYIKEKNKEETMKYLGHFDNAIRTLYVVSHSNAMKTYFAHARLGIVSHQDVLHRLHVYFAMNTIYARQGWDPIYTGVGMQEAEVGEDENDEAEEDQNLQGFHFNGSKSEIGSLYRRTFMSFVDHIAGLRLLERRSIYLPPDESIKLSLLAVKHPSPPSRYLPWGEMEKVIRKTCEVGSSTEPIKVEGQGMIKKIKAHLDNVKDCPSLSAIQSFKTLVKFDEKGRKYCNLQYPRFESCVHCESSLAIILAMLHSTQDDSNLRMLFQARRSLLSSSFTR